MRDKKKLAALVLAVCVAIPGAAAMAANHRDGKSEPQYHSSIQVPRGLESEAALQKLAKISLEDAVRIAQGAAAGTVTESGIENEDQNLVYTVEVRNASSTSEVVVDAGNGRVLAVTAERDGKDGKDEKDGEDGGERGDRGEGGGEQRN
jgi:uncharacterized membrane protein YkoI